MKSHAVRCLRRALLAMLMGFGLLAAIQAAAPAAAAGDQPASPARSRQTFDFDWRFYKGEVADAQNPGFDDSAWTPIDLPHDFSIAGPYDQKSPTRKNGGFLPGGVGWYRKSFNLANADQGRKIFVEFDGVYHHSDVWINGHHLGHRPYGFSSFEYDLTPYVRFDGPNVLAVRANNSDGLNCRWYSGSGINRHVWLTKTEPLYFDHWGIAIETPEVSARHATVRVRARVANAWGEETVAAVKIELLDPQGRLAGSAAIEHPTPAHANGEFETRIKIDQPALWSPDTPNLYTARLAVSGKGQTQDVVDVPFGVRSIRWDAKKGFILNGRPTKLKGVCLHEDLGPLGTAFNERGWERRLEILKSIGCNAIRTSHNAPAPQFLDLCDRMGFLVVDEAFDKWDGRFFAAKADFNQWWRADLDAMLLRDRNHPSVILWSVGNELQKQGEEKFFTTLQMLTDYVHKTDPTRPVTVALKPVGGKVPEGKSSSDMPVDEALKAAVKTAAIEDVISLNYMEHLADRIHKAAPNRPIFSSESYDFFGSRDLNFHAFIPSNPWFDVAQRPYLAGQFIWVGIAYLGEAPAWPLVGWPDAPIDLCGFLNPQAYWRRSVMTNQPTVRIAVEDPSSDVIQGQEAWAWPKLIDHWTLTRFDKGSVIRFYTITNCETVEIVLNGKSMGTKSLAEFPNHLIEWWAPYAPGTIRAIGRSGGKIVAEHTLKTAGAPAKIVLEADRTRLSADGRDQSYVTARIVDAAGIPVPEARIGLDFQLEGPGRLAATGSGDLTDHTPFTIPHRQTYHGQSLAIVQSTRRAGTLRLTVSSQDLPTTAVLMMTGER